VNARFVKSRRHSMLSGLLMLLVAALSAAGAAPKQVLLLHSFGREFAPFHTVSETFRTELGQQLDSPVEFHDVALESARFEGEAAEPPLVDYLTALFSPRRPDLVVTIGGPAARLAQKYRPRLFPSTPMLLAAVDERLLQTVALTTNDAVVAVTNNLVAMMEGILQLFPETTNVAMVIGNSPLEKFWLAETRRQMQPFTNRLSLTWLNDSSFAEVLKRAAALPPRSAIYYFLMSVDAEGVPYAEERALRELHAVANAPIFGLHDSQLGRGIVGGPLMAIEELSRNTAKVAARILRGEPAGSIKTPTQVAGRPVYDWRELKRWGVSEARLPKGSVIRFRQPTFWEQYRWRIVGLVVFCGVQTALIISLIVNGARRRQAQAVTALVADLSSRFINVPPGKVDGEIKDGQRRVCECMGLDLSALWQWSENRPDLVTLTHLYRPLGGPAIPEPMNGLEYFPWCVSQLLEGKTVTVSSMAALPPEAARDREVWHGLGITSNLTFPLSAGGGQVFGALGFNTVRAARSWPEELVRQLQLVAQIFANALARKQADQALRESEARLTLAADAAGSGLWSLHLDTGRFWLTDKTRELFGFAADEVVTFERFMDQVHPEDRGPVRQAVQAMVDSKKESIVEYRVLQPGGTVRWMSSRGRVQCSATGEPDHLMGATADITPRKQAEAEVMQQRGELAHVARVSVMGELATSLAHELNQPLGAILSNAEAAELFLQQDPPPLGELRAILADIRKDDERAGEVIRRMRSLLRKRQLEREPLDINLLVEDVFRLVSADASLRYVTINADLSLGLPPVEGDRIHLQQVLLNVILNALDAMVKEPPGKRRLAVRTSHAGNSAVEVSVTDSGPGIEPDNLPRIFEPFFTTKPNGIGMGLSISRKIVEAHGGSISAENHPAGGAVFRVTLSALTEGNK